MNSAHKNRIYCFDLLKLFSILYVFVYHIFMDMYVIHPMHNLKLIEDLTIRPNMHFAMIACGLFIFISGATITYSNKNRDVKPIEFYKKRLTRVLIPFYIAYIIYFVIKVISLKNIHIYGGVPKWQFIWTILGIDEYLNACGIKTFSLGIGEWFLGCIIFCYLAYPFLFKAHKKNKIVTFVVMTICYIALNVNYNKFNFVIPSHMNFLCQVYNFYLGIVFADIASSANVVRPCVGASPFVRASYASPFVRASYASPFVRASYASPFVRASYASPKTIWLLILTIPTILFFYMYKLVINIPDNFKTTIVVVAIIISFYIFEDAISQNKFLNKTIPIFSKISYEFFLVHHFVIYQVDFMLNYQRLSGISTLIVIIIDFVLTILIAEIVNKISNLVYKSQLWSKIEKMSKKV